MKVPNHFDEEALEFLLLQQKRLAWDAEEGICWERGVDFSRPFVPLDQGNIFFPGVTAEERLAVSQFMGLMIAATISEMELTMQRLREISWRPLMKRYSVNPELIALGENFFAEESKHALVFQRFIDLCARELSVDPETLKSILPRINPGCVEKILRLNARMDGITLWWIVATVEEESVLIYHQMHPHKNKLDPLYYNLHRRHFEEESRHAPYPFIMLRLGQEKAGLSWHTWLRKNDFVISEMLKMMWMFFELSKVFDVSKLKSHHAFFKTLGGLIPKLKNVSLTKLLSSCVRETPYISSFINPLYHPHTKKAIARNGVFALPFPEPIAPEVNW